LVSKKNTGPKCINVDICQLRNELIGQARIESINEESIIGVSVDVNHRGKGYASRIIELTSAKFYEMKKKSISAYIKVENIASIKAFEEAGYGNKMLVNIQGNESLKLTYK
jgi:RimJ/RimL family protein N-acetyltransferase